MMRESHAKADRFKLSSRISHRYKPRNIKLGKARIFFAFKERGKRIPLCTIIPSAIIRVSRLAKNSDAISPHANSGSLVNKSGPGFKPHIISPPRRTAPVPEPGIPRARRGAKEPAAAALFAASQAAQNTYLVNALSPAPVPSYQVPNPYTGMYGYRACCNTCGCTV